jgi:hypothetical protein
MSTGQMQRKAELPERKSQALENMHRLFLEALRHREQEIIKYVAILGPALSGFVWLLGRVDEPLVFSGGTIGVILVLFLGAAYALALGYNYRYITLQLAKLESDECLAICDHMLTYWLRTPEQFRQVYCVESKKPRCDPPEIIKVSWIAFLSGIIVVALSGAIISIGMCRFLEAVVIFVAGGIFLWFGIVQVPRYFGRKMGKMVEMELGDWSCSAAELRKNS